MEIFISNLENKIGYIFKNKQLLETALRHASAVNEIKKGLPSNERMEFLGDAILNVCLTDYLYFNFPKQTEGELTMKKAYLQSEQTLANIARNVNLGAAVILGESEKNNNANERDRLLADVMEAVIAAIYLDADFETIKKVISKLYYQNFGNLDDELQKLQSKNVLQTITNRKYKINPEYIIANVDGPDHQRSYSVIVKINGEDFGCGTAANKKEAELLAAKMALQKLKNYE